MPRARKPAAARTARGEDPATRRLRARAVLRRLAKENPDWGPTLEFSSPFELLVATILAAQAQDEHINQVTRSLFAKYRGPADYLKVPRIGRGRTLSRLQRQKVWKVVERYVEKTGRKVDDFRFYEVYGLFRLAVIAQQIYFRYHHKETHNPAFKNFWVFAHYLAWRCKKLITRYA